MRYARFLPLLFIFLLFSCGGKQESGSMIALEDTPVEVELPAVQWEQSVNIEPYLIRTDEVSTVHNIIEEWLVSDLAKDQTLKITRRPEHHIPDPDYTVYTSISWDGSLNRLGLHIIDNRNDSASTRFDMEATDETLIMMVNEASSNIRTTIHNRTIDKARQSRSYSSEMMQVYFKGVEALRSDRRSYVDSAVVIFKTILRSDSTFLPALLGLSDSYVAVRERGKDNKLVWMRLAMQSCMKAVSLYPDDDGAYQRLGHIYSQYGDFKRAEEAYKKCLNINTSNMEAWLGLGTIYYHFGLYEPALKIYDTILALNRQLVMAVSNRAMILIGYNRYKEAENSLRDFLRIAPGSHFMGPALALSLYYQGKYAEAGAALEKAATTSNPPPINHAINAMIHIRQGRSDDGLSELEMNLKPLVANNSGLALATAAVYSLLGRNGQALNWLERAVTWGYKEYPWLMNDPNFENLRHDERIDPILEKLKTEWQERITSFQKR